MPFLFGGGLAFVFNIIANNLMRAGNILFKIEERKIYRVIANILSIVIVLALFLGFVFLLVPQIFASLETIINNLPETLNSFYHWAYRTSSSIPSLHNWIQGLDLNVLDFDNLSNWFNDFINWIFSGGANNIFGSVYQVISTTFSIVLSTFVALMFSIIVLFNKSTVVKESKGLLRAYMPDDIYEKTLHVLRLIARTFTQYIGGTCTECIILGTLVTVGATLLNIPYATLVGIIVGVGALVPMFGALIAAIIGALFVATESVQSAVYFMIMFICIQQVEGNFIYPNVVGRSVGFPPMYVIVAVTVGASLGGILGIIISIPVCSCIYQLVKEDVVMRLKVKKHSTTSS
jgi:predicted PurR-regulated permease PerM